jgi:hypothetical protein
LAGSIPVKTPTPEAQSPLVDPERPRLPELVAPIDPELPGAVLSPQPGLVAPAPAESIASWAEVVRLLALGRTPELRECPVCGEAGVRAAKLCDRCWAELPPLISE